METQTKTVEQYLDNIFEMIMQIADATETSGLPEDALLNSPEVNEWTINQLKKHKDLLSESAAYFRQTSIYIKSNMEAESLVKEIAAEPVDRRPTIAFDWLTDRIAASPMRIFMEAAIILVIPFVDQFLNDYLQTLNTEAGGK